jgi:putative ABC transport system permease protein
MTHDDIPEWPVRFLRAICPEHLLEEIEGDLFQKYNKDLKLWGRKKARQKFIWNVVRFFRPGIILRNKFSFQLIDTTMLRSYLTIATRNVLKSKVFSAINILGLGIGLAACLLIFQFVSFELSYDSFNEKLDRTYRITNDRFQNGKLIQHGTIMYPTIGPVMAKDYAEIEEYTRLMPGGDLNVKINDKNFRGDRCHFADEYFLSVFDYKILAGQRSSLLKEPYTAVLTAHVARKFFDLTGDNYIDIIGKTFYWGLDATPYTVKGVCEDIPSNSHLQFDALISYSTLIRPEDQGADNSWTWSDMRHYLVLKPGVNYKALESKFSAFSDRYFKGDKVSGSVEKFYLQPLRDAHLYSDYEYDIATTASGKAVWAMVVVAIFILVIAWINYINLTTSRALDRAKEVGLRKVMGAGKGQLVRQFILESLIITAMAFIVAFVLVTMLQSSFNQIVGTELSLFGIFKLLHFNQIAILILVLVIAAVLSGFYPAFVLSSYHPVIVLKGKFTRSRQGGFLRKALVVFQFTSSSALIIGTFIVAKQIEFMNKADLGIDIQNIVIIQSPQLMPWDSTFIDRVESYKHALTQVDGVVSATTSWRLPGDRLGRSFGIHLSDQDAETHYTLSNIGVDHNFFDTYNVSLLSGRKFLPTDHNADFAKLNTVVINRNAVQLLGIKNVDEAIGKEVVWGDDGKRKLTIVGVVDDFHQEGLQKPMEPMIFLPAYSTYSPTSVRIRTADTKQTVADIEAIYKKFFPGNSFEYSFLEDNYKRQYSDDRRFGRIVTIFTLLAIIVSCLGLIGLSSYTAVQRTKEIGIRKVLGASLINIISILSFDFVRLVFIAAILSLPVAYFGMQNWLEGYAYRITPGWSQFVLPVGIVVIIAAVTISFQVMKTAMTNPAETIKYE